jgi:hypothetical protein
MERLSRQRSRLSVEACPLLSRPRLIHDGAIELQTAVLVADLRARASNVILKFSAGLGFVE